mgnify:CR=1 FL=1
METMGIHVLLVDDQRADYVITRDLLEEGPLRGCTLDWAPDFAKGLEVCRSRKYDVVLLDYMLNGHTGLEFFHEARAAGVKTPFIMLTAYGERDVDIEAMKAGVAEFLIKADLSAPLLERTIRYVIKHDQMRRQIERSRDDMLSILDGLRIGTAMSDEAGRITFVSRAFERLSGHRRASLLGRPWQELFPVAKAGTVPIGEMMARPPGQRAKIQLEWDLPTGQQYCVEVEIQDDPHSEDRKIFVLYDISDVRGLRRLLDEKARFRDIIGRSEAMRLVYRQIEELARFDSTVLIEGETGTGKELVARAIHYSSHRKDKPFVAVNCAGLTDSLLASQLFGHRRGAFTGAIEDHKGFFEAAQGGTVFLDEIADIPLCVQKSLLRVLQEREVVRVGEATPRKIDVRVLVATNQNLADLVAESRLRPDLLYRIRVARVALPPLRSRREDIPLLVDWFLRQFRARTDKTVEGIDPAAMRTLMEHDWPGNVRELQNAIEAAAIACRSRLIANDDLPPEILRSKSPMEMTDYWDRERANLQQALAYTGGNRAKAARMLGISRATLYRRLAALESHRKPG